MEFVSNGFGMNSLKFKVRFTATELSNYEAYGHEAKCYLMINAPTNEKETDIDTDDFSYVDSQQDQYNKSNRTEINFQFIKKSDNNIIIEFVLEFKYDEDVEVKTANIVYRGKEPSNHIFNNSSISYYNKQIELILEKIFNRQNQGVICNDCSYKYQQILVSRCFKLYKS